MLTTNAISVSHKILFIVYFAFNAKLVTPLA
jgi:hypothetical protein